MEQKAKYWEITHNEENAITPYQWDEYRKLRNADHVHMATARGEDGSLVVTVCTKNEIIVHQIFADTTKTRNLK